MKNKLLFIISSIWFAVPALASGGGEKEAGGANPFSGDIGPALWTTVIFLLVVFVLGKFAWGPVLSGLQGREDFIKNSLEEAKNEREEAKALLADYRTQLDSARSEATAIVEEGRRDAEVLRRKIEADANAEAKAAVERARREIELAKEDAIEAIYIKGANLATDLASKILGAEIDPKAHDRLIRESIEKLDRTAEN